jgi:para-nitrobenzyl esterase
MRKPARLGAAHCADLPFFLDTIDAYPASPMLGDPTTEARSLGRTFSRAAGAFIATDRPAVYRWYPYEPSSPATIRHFRASD